MSQVQVINKGNGRIIVGPVRLSYAYLTEKFDPKDGTVPVYKADLLIDAADTAAVDAIRAAFADCVTYGQSTKWGGKKPASLQLALHEPDPKAESDLYKNSWVLRVKSKDQPGILGLNKQPITNNTEVYSGMWAYVSVSLYPYATAGKFGIGAILNNVLKYRDDEPLGGGRQSAESDFAGIDITPDITESLL